jgi:hypothetical protein
MIRDRFKRLAGRLRGKSSASAASSPGIGAGFTPADSASLLAFSAASDLAFGRIEAQLASLDAEAAAPLREALQGGARLARGAARKGAKAGESSGQLGHATAPLGAALREAAERLEAAVAPAVAAGAPVAVGEVAQTARDAAGRFGGALARLPMRASLESGLLEALASWEGMVLPSIERAVVGDAGPDET